MQNLWIQIYDKDFFPSSPAHSSAVICWLWVIYGAHIVLNVNEKCAYMNIIGRKD